MAVEKKWVISDVESGKKGSPGKLMPGQTYSFATTFEVAEADSDGSIYKLAMINSNMIPLEIEINCDAIAGATDYDLGFYDNEGNAVDADVLMDGADINAGKAIGSEQNGLASLAVENIGKKVWELCGKTVNTKENAYVLALTANTVGTAAGTISVRGEFVQG